MTELRDIEDEINDLKENINKLVIKKNYLTDSEILTASEELDNLINLYMEQMKLKNESATF